MHSENATPIMESTEYKMKIEATAEDFGWVIVRTENNEVICYIYDSSDAGGLQCKWK